MKRLLDIIIIILSLPVTLPVFCVVSIFVSFTLGKPIIYQQQRPGLNGLVFRMYKFRSMTDQRDTSGVLLPNDERLTKAGRFLRSSSLDELPELWNVIKGDMSLVGPRPLKVEYLPLYNKEQFRRHEIKPGITGWAQVNGRNALNWNTRFKLDVWYVDNHSIFLDWRILWMTIFKIFSRENITPQGSEFSQPFKGDVTDLNP